LLWIGNWLTQSGLYTGRRDVKSENLACYIFSDGSSNSSWAQDGFIDGSPALAYWQIGKKKEVVIVLSGEPAAQHEYLRPEFDALKK
jgi:hypothetical protein